MTDGNIRQVLAGRKPLVVGMVGGPVDRIWLRQGIPHGGANVAVRPPAWRTLSCCSTSPHRRALGEPVDIMDAGFACAYLATPLASRVTGGTVYEDGGAHIVA
jgi:hypothetical protein